MGMGGLQGGCCVNQARRQRKGKISWVTSAVTVAWSEWLALPEPFPYKPRTRKKGF